MEEFANKAFIKKLKAGNEQAFNSLVTYYTPKIRAFIMSYSGLNAFDADEIASDVLFKVHKSIKGFNPDQGGKLTTWIFEIAKNKAIDYTRWRSRQQSKLSQEMSLEELETKSKSKNRLAISATRQEEVLVSEQQTTDEATSRTLLYRQAFDSLSEEDKNILQMRQVMAYEEIANIEQTSVGTLRARHARAVQRFRAAYEREISNGR